MTAALQLWSGPRSPSVSLGIRPARTCRLLIESLPSSAPSPWRFSAIGTVACQPLTLSVVLPSGEHPTHLPRCPRQRTPVSTNQSAWPRFSCPFRTLSRAGEERRAPTPAISTIHEHHRGLPSPVSTFPEVALVTRVPRWPRPFQGAVSRVSLVQGPDSAFAAPSAPR